MKKDIVAILITDKIKKTEEKAFVSRREMGALMGLIRQVWTEWLLF